jgi:hypothetical protein
MTGLITTARWNRVATIPLVMPQTELRRKQDFIISEIRLDQGWSFELRYLWLFLTGFIYYSGNPESLFSLPGLCSVGLYYENMGSSPLFEVVAKGAGTYGGNLFNPCVISTPGTYIIGARNHTKNTGLMVCATGAGRLYT